ncbi:hypothetical protein SAMD00019534_111500 [Acytostelium subglobosum LB1]|uniref:hypothetical protein n=1 Tax=Acytostelium subglobosum LB1 TaxID=1410327 RepID=UPI0006450522|nr:hypothetical protein SAMD00019534_111500 [Acytostelium subglobosum LB1]GAM27974.1 hypothetical protein SAMD00019534_111500 [Acytostelium subglobosum LB1]|eukprot:XP_012748933.1 hypothetical protein SAMD00019534_111500 [Acytostelium subglobosum LB1]
MDIEHISASDDLSNITSIEILKRVNALLKLQERIQELDQQKEKELHLVDMKFQPEFDKLYTKRATFVSGAAEPTEEECAAEVPVAVEGLTSGDAKGIPSFWFNALVNSGKFESIIGDNDQEVLQYLNDINISNLKEDQSFTLNFVFATNPYFTNESVQLELVLKDEQLESIRVSPVEWKEGKKTAVTKLITEKKMKKKGPKGKKPTVVTKTIEENAKSIFTTLLIDASSPDKFSDALAGEEDDEDMEDDEGNVAEASFRYVQYQAIVDLKDSIIPSAIESFLGRVEDEDDEGMYMDGEDEEMDFDDEDDEEDDDEDDEPVNARRTGGNKARQPTPPAPTNPECKQQ